MNTEYTTKLLDIISQAKTARDKEEALLAMKFVINLFDGLIPKPSNEKPINKKPIDDDQIKKNPLIYKNAIRRIISRDKYAGKPIIQSLIVSDALKMSLFKRNSVSKDRIIELLTEMTEEARMSSTERRNPINGTIVKMYF